MLIKVDTINLAYMGTLFLNIAAFVAFAISMRKNKEGGSCVISAKCPFLDQLVDEW